MTLTVGIAGLGAVGLPLAQALDRGQVPGVRLAAISVRNVERARTLVQDFALPPAIVPLAELPTLADAVVESLPSAAFDEIADATIAAGKVFLPLSAGQLLRRNELMVRAAETGARIVVPTGALLGLDAVRAAAEGEIHSVTMVTRKPPHGLAGAPYIEQHGIDLDAVQEPTRIFSGTARDAAAGFPANINVAVALSLAGIGPDHTMVEIWADPTVDRNTHTVKVDSDAVRFEMTIENIPTEANPRTGKLTALSTIAALRSLVATLRVGT